MGFSRNIDWLSMTAFSLPSLKHKLARLAEAVETHSNVVRALSDAQLREQFQAEPFPDRRSLPRALALAKEAATRALGMKAYPEQLMGAAVLFDGVIAEMKTGEGKTLSIALAASLAALARRGVHVATVNAYLAERDSTHLQRFYSLLGLTVGAVLPNQDLTSKRAAYRSDVTYGVHSELGFDYLRDHLVAHATESVQRERFFVIVDEADSILIDEARTPLIISQSAGKPSPYVALADQIVRALHPSVDVTVSDADRQVVLTEAGFERVSTWLRAHGLISEERSLYETDRLHLMRFIDAALKARFVYQRDRDYVIRNGEILIVDDSTGRTLAGRRWQGGVHQAVEALAGVPVQAESETAAEISYQSYFKLYSHLCGLTGTALTAAEEFEALYGRATVAIPTHRPCRRQDLPDLLYADRAAKFHAIVDDVYARHQRAQPVLIGTTSVEESEAISAWLQWAQLPHEVLNARQPEREAGIIARAGLPGAITVATNMAGRGTDILLGGPAEESAAYPERARHVRNAGGLHVIGTQRQDCRRVDDQLAGRAGRQGDPGSSQFYLSLEDDLLRLYGNSQQRVLLNLLADTHSSQRSARALSRIIQGAQQKLTAMGLSARSQLMRTDNVLAQQRAVVYALREAILQGEADVETLDTLIEHVIGSIVDSYLNPSTQPQDWDLPALLVHLQQLYHFELPAQDPRSLESTAPSELRAQLIRQCQEAYRAVRGDQPTSAVSERERLALLSALDRSWRAQLTYLDGLREGLHWKSYVSTHPEHGFAKDAFEAFERFIREYENLSLLLLTAKESGVLEHAPELPTPAVSPASRLAPCPCGSGRRFKHCHGQLPSAQS